MARLTDIALECCVLNYTYHLGLIPPNAETVRGFVEKHDWLVESLNENYLKSTPTLDTYEREGLWDALSLEYLNKEWPDNCSPEELDQMVASLAAVGWKIPPFNP